MKILSFIILCLFCLPSRAWSAQEGMPNMPRIVPKKTYSVESRQQGEDLLEERGFGDQEPMVRMMNLMMVGGSGYEGMDMSKMSMAQAATTQQGHAHAASAVPSPAEGQTATYDVQTQIKPDPPHVGANILSILIQAKNTKEAASGLAIKAQVYMLSMDMGTDEPRVKEVAPGKYQAKVTFSMAGPWAVKLSLPEGGEKVISFDVK